VDELDQDHIQFQPWGVTVLKLGVLLSQC